jgi:hypothetical protein
MRNLYEVNYEAHAKGGWLREFGGRPKRYAINVIANGDAESAIRRARSVARKIEHDSYDKFDKKPDRIRVVGVRKVAGIDE